MSRCRHRRLRGGCYLAPWKPDAGFWPEVNAVVRWEFADLTDWSACADWDALVCIDCGHWLPLGPATDTAETEVECRAYALSHGANDFSPDEREGWRRHESGRDVIGDSGDSMADAYHQRYGMHGWVARRWAGWLAREMGEDA